VAGPGDVRHNGAAPAAGGELAAFRQLLERWFDPCVDVAWQVLHDVDAAAEVTQDAFATAWHAHLARKPADEAGTLLMRATRDSALGRLAQQRHAEPGSEPWPSSGAPALGDQPGRDRGADLLRAVSAALGESDASVLDLHLRHGFSVDQVAHALGAPRNDTQQLLMQLKRRLGRAVRAWALWRDGRPDGGPDATGCAELGLALDENGVRAFGPEAVTVIARHAKACERCQDRQRLTGTPESLVAAVPIVPADTVVAARAAEVLRARGIPLHPPAGGTGGAFPAGTAASPPGRVPASSSGPGPAGAPAFTAPAPPGPPPAATPTTTESGSPAAPAGPGSAAAAYAPVGPPPTLRDAPVDVGVPPSTAGPRTTGDAWSATAAAPVAGSVPAPAHGESAVPLTAGQPAARHDGPHLWATATFASAPPEAPGRPAADDARPAPPAPGWATPPTSGDASAPTATTARHTTRSDDAWAPISTTAATAGAAGDAWAPLGTSAGRTGASGDAWAPVGATAGSAGRSGNGSAPGHPSGDGWAAAGHPDAPGAGHAGQDRPAPFGADGEPGGGGAGRRSRKWPALAAAALLLLVVGSVGAMALSGGEGADDEAAGGGGTSTSVSTATTVSPEAWTVPDGPATTAPGPDSPTTTASLGTDPAVPSATTAADPSTDPGATTTTVLVERAGDAPDILTFRVVSQTLGTPCAADDRRVTLAWESPDAETVTLDGPGAPSGTQPSSGQATVCRPQGDPVTYTLTATGPGGTATRTTTV